MPGPAAVRLAAAEIFPEALIPGVAARRVSVVPELRPDAYLAARLGHLDDSATVDRDAMGAVDPVQPARYPVVPVPSPVGEAQFLGAELAGRFALPLKRAQLQLVAAEPARSDVLDASSEQDRQA